MAIYSSEAGDLMRQYQAALDEQAEAIRALAAATNNPLARPDPVAITKTLEFHEARLMALRFKLEPFKLKKG